MARAASTAFGVSARQLRRTAKSPPLWLPSLLFPLLLFAAFAGGLSALGGAPNFDYPDYTTFQFVWVLLQASAVSAMQTALVLADDFDTGFARRMMLGSPRHGPIVAGYVIASVVRAVAIIAILFAIGLLVGMEVSGTALQIAGVIALVLLFNVAVTLWGTGVSLRTRSVQAAGPALQTPILILLLLAPVYAPRNLLTGWVHGAASANPVTPVIEAARGLMVDDPVKLGLAFGILAGMVVLTALWAVTGLRRSESEGAGAKGRK
jgi:ABC-2 type transport system permease protein